MPLITAKHLQAILTFIGETVEVDHRTGVLAGDYAEHISMARSIMQRVADSPRVAWPAGAMPLLELVANVGKIVMTCDRTRRADPRLAEVLKRLGHESERLPRLEAPMNPKLIERQSDILGAIRYTAEQIRTREAATVARQPSTTVFTTLTRGK